MKIKEFFPSLIKSLRLRRLKFAQLHSDNRPASEVIVSLTSIPSRLRLLDLTIRSLMIQSVRPAKILLWLHEDLRGKEPKALRALVGEIFSIHYSDLTCSHRKLIHTLELYPDAVIITCDDDQLYPIDWLERLVEDHKRFPGEIIANECKSIACSADGETLPYKQWSGKIDAGFSDASLMPVGYGGVLYPPDSLLPEVTDSDLFLRLAPKADDLWFKAMSFLKGTPCRKASNPSATPIPVIGTRQTTLAQSNVKLDQNREQWDALREYFQFTTVNSGLN
ncbi:MAG: hypothetical protein PVF23_01150 [Chromatiales bacterium]|jgi:hypothetical protein